MTTDSFNELIIVTNWGGLKTPSSNETINLRKINLFVIKVSKLKKPRREETKTNSRENLN